MEPKPLRIRLNPKREIYTEIRFRRATIADGLHRAILEDKGNRTTKPRTTLRWMKSDYYPVCVSAIEDPTWLREISFRKFSALDETDTDRMYVEALKQNPHWNYATRLDPKKAEERKWNIEEWLQAAYDNPEAEDGAMPAFEEKVFVFGRMSDELLESAKRILAVLELTQFSWTIKQVLEQPEELLDAVFYMKNIGERMRIQTRLKNKPKPRG
jgi:hypothetical protein